jgi:hypothetical protein
MSAVSVTGQSVSCSGARAILSRRTFVTLVSHLGHCASEVKAAAREMKIAPRFTALSNKNVNVKHGEDKRGAAELMLEGRLLEEKIKEERIKL